MNITSSKELAVALAFIAGLITSFLAGMSGSLFNNIFISSALIFVFTAFVIYWISYWLIEQYLNKKIELIYKSIRRSNQSNKNETTLTKVEEEVAEWMKKSEAELAQLNIKEKYSREFIGNVAHELKTPIFNIQGYVLTLLEGGLEDKNINKKYLERTAKSVDRMITLVEDLDTITRIESRDQELNMEKVDIVDVCEEAIDLLEDRAKEHSIKIKLDKEYLHPIYVKCDRKRITQVLNNLLINSIKYGNENGATIIGLYKVNDEVLVEVGDNGLGIEEKHLSRLFERFYRIEQSRSRDSGGTGLGLSIVKHILDAHGQSINVNSTLGKGTTFSFNLQKA